MATDERLPDCVIASSNRFNDIHPYCNRLYAEDSKRWGDIMPWEFPQGATSKEVEEEFLRKFFTETEIHMQGGASGNGEGFRFLKQVWYSIALFNWNTRIPALSDWWFEHNQDLSKDPRMMKHMLKDDVEPSTFFQSNELAMYGEKFLKCTIKAIQWKLDHPEELQTPKTDEKSSSSDSQPSEPPQSDKGKHQTQTMANRAAASDKPITPAPASTPLPAPLPFKPEAKMFTPELTAIVPNSARGNPEIQPRSFSGDSYPTQDARYQQTDKRGSWGKRSSFHDRTGLRSNEWPKSKANAPMSLGPPTLAFGSMMPYGSQPPQALGPPFGPGFRTNEYMPALPQGQQASAPSPPGVFQSRGQPGHPPSYLPNHHAMANPSAYPQGMTPAYYNAPQALTDRSNGQLGGRNFSHDSSFANMDGRLDHTAKNRRSSVSSRGGKRGGFHSGRGRVSGGRNSIGQDTSVNDGMLPYHKQNNDIHHPSFGFEPKDGRSNMPQSDKNWRGNPGSTQDENSFPRGDARYDADFNRPYQPSSAQHVPMQPGSNMTPVYAQATPAAMQNPAPFSHGDRGNQEGFRSIKRPCPENGCTRDEIGANCYYATKLIAFNIPLHVTQAELDSFFESFGQVLSVNRAGSIPRPEARGPPWVFINFTSATSARKCLMISMNNPWNCRLEVAKEFWDSNYQNNPRHRRNASSVHGPHSTMPSEIPHPRTTSSGHGPHLKAPLEVRAPHMPFSPRLDVSSGNSTPRAADIPSVTVSSELTSGDTTPTASGPVTPRKKSKKKKSKKFGLREDSLANAFEANAQKHRTGISPVPEESGNEGSIASEENRRPDTPIYESSTGDASPFDDKSTNSESAAQGVVAERLPAVPEPTAELGQNTADTLPTSSSAFEKPYADPSEKYTPPEVLAPKEVKKEEEPMEDSFHTADKTPGEEKEAVLVDKALSTTEDEQATEAAVSTPVAEESNAESQAAEEIKRATPTLFESKKAPVPQIPSKVKAVAIALPSIDTSKAVSKDSDQTSKLQSSTQQRAVSGESEPASSSFVTAPNTPAIEDVSTQALQQKKAAKSKGPAETESLSMFCKSSANTKKSTKQQQKGNGGSIKCKPDPMVDLPKPEPISKSKLHGSKPKRETGAGDFGTRGDATTFSSTDMDDKSEKSAAGSDAAVVQSAAEVTTSPQPSFFDRMGMGGILKNPWRKPKPEFDQDCQGAPHTAESPETMPVDQLNVDSEDLVDDDETSTAAIPSTETAEPAGKAKKGKKNKLKNRKKNSATLAQDGAADERSKDNQTASAKVETIVMEQPAKSNEQSKAIYEAKGSQFGPSSPLKPSPTRKIASHQSDHLLGTEANRNSQKYSRSVSGKSSEGVNSVDESAVTNKKTDGSENMSDMRVPNEEELLGLGLSGGSPSSTGEQFDKPEDHVVSDEAKKSQEKLREMAEKEAKIKAAKAAKGKNNAK